MSKALVEDSVNLYFQKKFKNITEKLDDGSEVPIIFLYDIVAKPKQVNMDSPEIQRLIMRVTAIHMTGRSTKYVNLTQLFNPIYQLCKFCREDKYLAILEGLWAKGTIGLSIPDLERKVLRGGALPRVSGKIIKFDALNYSFKQVEQKLDLVFNDVCAKNNIPQTPFDLGKVLDSVGHLEQQG